jgi:high-affinity nickel-transport protein
VTLTTAAPDTVSAFDRFRRGLSPADRRSLWAMGAFIVLLHVVGLGILFGLVTPQHFRLGGDHPVFTVGVGVLAYTFGLRHAFDADHIAAVDNTTRKLLADETGRKPLSVGFWFSLGHSTIVFLLALLLSMGSSACSTSPSSSASSGSSRRCVAASTTSTSSRSSSTSGAS